MGGYVMKLKQWIINRRDRKERERKDRINAKFEELRTNLRKVKNGLLIVTEMLEPLCRDEKS